MNPLFNKREIIILLSLCVSILIWSVNVKQYSNTVYKYLFCLTGKEEIAEDLTQETFAIAIYACLKYSDDFENAIICSINHDGDSDSTGSVAGNIIGASLGYNKIPDYYKDNIELKNIIIELADDLSVDVPVSEYSTNNDKNWLDKYWYCK